jgi:arylsulfatase A-like enzyme
VFFLVNRSDNGGCFLAGGKNGPLRGTKGSLFEGGIKVNAFIFSTSLIPSKYRGTKYSSLMHVTDWFPTILDLADINYDPPESKALDGYSQVDAWYGGTAPRSHVLYNFYYNVAGMSYNLWTNGSAAIRNER